MIVHYILTMQRWHPLATDDDLSIDDVAASEGRCALALGRLDGVLMSAAKIDVIDVFRDRVRVP